jgi:Fur family zinc uptake transcriptional regulator
MTHHHHHHVEASGENLAVEAQNVLERSGESWTDMRAQIFEAVSDIGKPASAYEIAEIVSAKRGKRVAPNSVYRILDLFVATNLVRRIESSNAFIVNSHPGCYHDCIFLICDRCGNATHVDDDHLARAMRAAAQTMGFAPERPIMEMRGTCADCTQQAA